MVLVRTGEQKMPLNINQLLDAFENLYAKWGLTLNEDTKGTIRDTVYRLQTHYPSFILLDTFNHSIEVAREEMLQKLEAYGKINDVQKKYFEIIFATNIHQPVSDMLRAMMRFDSIELDYRVLEEAIYKFVANLDPNTFRIPQAAIDLKFDANAMTYLNVGVATLAMDILQSSILNEPLFKMTVDSVRDYFMHVAVDAEAIMQALERAFEESSQTQPIAVDPKFIKDIQTLLDHAANMKAQVAIVQQAEIQKLPGLLIGIKVAADVLGTNLGAVPVASHKRRQIIQWLQSIDELHSTCEEKLTSLQSTTEVQECAREIRNYATKILDCTKFFGLDASAAEVLVESVTKSTELSAKDLMQEIADQFKFLQQGAVHPYLLASLAQNITSLGIILEPHVDTALQNKVIQMLQALAVSTTSTTSQFVVVQSNAAQLLAGVKDQEQALILFVTILHLAMLAVHDDAFGLKDYLRILSDKPYPEKLKLISFKTMLQMHRMLLRALNFKLPLYAADRSSPVQWMAAQAKLQHIEPAPVAPAKAREKPFDPYIEAKAKLRKVKKGPNGKSP